MKKIIGIALMTMALTFICAAEANAQLLPRIQFAKGKNSATVRGKTGSYGVYYSLRARAGQKVTLTLSPSSAHLLVQQGAEDILLRKYRGGTYEIYLESGEELSILVGSANGKSVPYVLTVKITDMTDI